MDANGIQNTDLNQDQTHYQVEFLKRELDYALSDLLCAPKERIAQTILDVLNNAEKNGRLTSPEREEICRYIKKTYDCDLK